jgi:Na+-transporting NADH:ubiquinone oxidoreductase subunit B/electron transport complex protein RnfD
MKWLLKIFEDLHPHFGPNGRFRMFGPLFEAVDNFFFSPKVSTPTAPHIRDPIDLKRFMTMVVFAMLPCTIASVYFFGLRVLAVILVSYAVGGLAEVVIAVIRKEKINEGFLVTGLIFPLVLPPTLPLWMVALGVLFGVVVGKELFGGTGRNLFNPAIAGRCFLGLGYPVAMSSGWVIPGAGPVGRLFQYVSASTVDAISKATPLGLVKQGTLTDILPLFVGNVSGCIGETSGIAIIAGGLFLLWTRVANWRTVVSVLTFSFLMAEILHNVNPHACAPALWHLGAGGLLFGAFFMATDPVTCPATNAGKWIFGAIVGIVTILIRCFSGYVEGVMFAILIGNTVSPLLDEMVYKIQMKRLANEA